MQEQPGKNKKTISPKKVLIIADDIIVKSEHAEALHYDDGLHLSSIFGAEHSDRFEVKVLHLRYFLEEHDSS